jgi:hypothetical protein
MEIHITLFHVLVLHMAALLKFLVVYSKEEKKLKEEDKAFSFNHYFSDRWDNWAVHYISMWCIVLVVPGLVEGAGQWWPLLKEIKGNTAINIPLTFAAGFFGYNMIEFIMDKLKSKVVDK